MSARDPLLRITAWTAALLVAAPMAAPAHEYSWTGFYVGVNVGYGWGDAETDASTAISERTRVFRAFGLPAQTQVSDVTVAGPSVAASASADVDGWLGGGQIGYNWQLDRLVLGLEADFQGTGQDGSSFFCSSVACGAGSAFAAASHDLDWFGTVRARIGYLIDPRLMLFATGGLAYGHISTEYTAGIVGGASLSFSEDKTKSGWVVGGGGEWAISKHLSLKAEYLYMDLGDIGSASGTTATATVITPNVPQQGFTTVTDTTASSALRSHFTDQIFRIGINYRFGREEHYESLK